MTNQQLNEYITKAINVEITKQQISIVLNKTELNTVLQAAMADEQAEASIKRILNPFLADSFPQFPSFTSISLGETTEEGTVVTLKQPIIRAKTSPKPDEADIAEQVLAEADLADEFTAQEESDEI